MRGAAFGLALFLVLFASGGVSAGGASEDLPTLGDANCDTAVASTDAAIVLQYAGAITPSVPCVDNADVDWNEEVNSVDASLVLQHVARLVPDFVRMSLVATTDSGTCEGPVCEVPTGAAFDVTVMLANNPTTGYVAMGTAIFYDHLGYEPSAVYEDEILWPDVRLPLRSPVRSGQAWIAHGGLSSGSPPFPVSYYVGQLVKIRLRCPEAPGPLPVLLVAYTDEFNAFTLGAGLGYATTQGQSGPVIYPAQWRESRDVDLDLNGRLGGWELGLLIADDLTIDCA